MSLGAKLLVLAVGWLWLTSTPAATNEDRHAGYYYGISR